MQPVLVAELPDYPDRRHTWWSCYVTAKFLRNIFTQAMPGLAWVCKCLWVQHRFTLVLGIKDHSCRIGYSLPNSCLHRHSHSLKVLCITAVPTGSEHDHSSQAGAELSTQASPAYVLPSILRMLAVIELAVLHLLQKYIHVRNLYNACTGKKSHYRP